MRIGIAGVGRIGTFHARTLSRMVEVVDSLVLADAVPGRAAAVAAELNDEGVEGVERSGGRVEQIEHVERVGDVFAAGIDGLVIAATSDAHAALLLGAVDAHIPVFCEKPVAPDVAATRAVLDKVRSADVPVQIGFQRRYDAGYRAARDAVAGGELGWVHTLRAGTLDPAPPPPEYLARSGGLFRDCTVHDFDAIRWVSGQEVAEVYAVGANRGAAYFGEVGDVDTAAALLTLTDGTLAQVAATRYNGAGYDVRLEVLGSRASIAVGLDEHLPLRSVEAGVGFPAGVPYPTFMERFQAAYAAELADFIGVIASNKQPGCTVSDALEAFLIAEACELSRTEHRPVRLDEVRA